MTVLAGTSTATAARVSGLGGSQNATAGRSASAAILAAAASLAASSSASPLGPADGGGTNRGDNARDGWYPDEPGLGPATVASPAFGKLFSTAVNGQVYAQPVLDDGVLLVATETDRIYGLDPVTGKVKWSRQVGNYFPDAVLGCGDLTPDLGVTSTPVVDPSTGIAYLVDQQYVSGSSGPTAYYVQAINPVSGAEEPHFPVRIGGAAANDPSETFVPDQQLNRTGLLLLGGVVYAAFSSHCDIGPYWGFVVGVSTSGRQTTMWSDEADTKNSADTNSGGGIWQTGSGLVSDGPNQILLTSGNGDPGTSPSGKIAASSPPADLGESVVRLAVQPNGSLKATNFFTPTDAVTLDQNDLDFGTSAPVALPPQFSTPQDPHLLVAGGKEGELYLLNRDNLGGVGTGPGGTDGTAATVATGPSLPYPMVFGSTGVWPGNGGYLYLPTSDGYGPGTLEAFAFGKTARGAPTLTLVTPAATAPAIGFASSSPIVTSNGTATGSAVVWVVNMNGLGSEGQLEAFAAVPAHGTLQLLRSWPVGMSTKFNGPGVADGRVYVATSDGHVLGFGEAVTAAVSGTGLGLPTTVDGSSNTGTVTLTANQDNLEVTAISSESGAFVVGRTTPVLPVRLAKGGHLAVEVTFRPVGSGEERAALAVSTSRGESDLPVSGLALTPAQFDEQGYRVATASGSVLSFGDANPSWCPGTKVNVSFGAVSAAATTPDGAGCWMTTTTGAVFAQGDARSHGSESGRPLKSPIVAMAPTPDGDGYWLAAADGGVFAFGDARFHGSEGGRHLNKPIVGFAPSSDGRGYWLVASDGGIFAFGDARFFGSEGSAHLNRPIVAMAAPGDGRGYWLVASDGGLFSFGDAHFYGSEGGSRITSPVVGMAATGYGEGYWLVQADGHVKAFGDAGYEGSPRSPLKSPAVAVIRP
jgi:hypothetical protein